ncbi:MAG: RNA polymerase sigma factor [Chitinophagales bacterium]|nr:RNA polymerase sigma factor [Chitinophagales bacterium]
MNMNDIIQGCIEQNRLSQKKLYESYYGKMLAVCMRYASNREEAREIMNVGFFKVFNTIAKYKPKIGNLDGWIYRIMINSAIDHYRKEARHKHHATLEHAAPVSKTVDVLDTLSAKEILELIQKLPPGYRTVFNLYVMDGFSHKEISAKLGIAEGTSKSNLAKARAKLQKMILKEQSYLLKNYVK